MFLSKMVFQNRNQTNRDRLIPLNANSSTPELYFGKLTHVYKQAFRQNRMGRAMTIDGWGFLCRVVFKVCKDNIWGCMQDKRPPNEAKEDGVLRLKQSTCARPRLASSWPQSTVSDKQQPQGHMHVCAYVRLEVCGALRAFRLSPLGLLGFWLCALAGKGR